jgi:hypothetical protein
MWRFAVLATRHIEALLFKVPLHAVDGVPLSAKDKNLTGIARLQF